MKRGGCSIRSREVGQGQTADDFQDGRPDLPDVRTPRECGGGVGSGDVCSAPPSGKRVEKKSAHCSLTSSHGLQNDLAASVWRYRAREALSPRDEGCNPTKVILIWFGKL